MFKLDFPVKPSTKKINLKDPIYLIGSCFSDEIGNLLFLNKFTCLSNPFGTIYNPYSLFKIVRDDIDAESFIERSGIYYHWDAHGEVSGLDKTALKNKLAERKETSSNFLKNTKWLILTPGTSWVYRLIESNEIVANCHKVPNTTFRKKLLSVDSIVASFKEMKSYLEQQNPEIQIILTVSPVRHIRDGLIENNRSKARLIEAVHQIVAETKNAYYFPSYEICMDELRDYRFYAEDLIHPSQQAINYVWDRFSKAFFDQETLAILSTWNKLKSAMNHRPLHVDSKEHQDFLRNNLEKLEKLNQKIDVSVELKTVKDQLK